VSKSNDAEIYYSNSYLETQQNIKCKNEILFTIRILKLDRNFQPDSFLVKFDTLFYPDLIIEKGAKKSILLKFPLNMNEGEQLLDSEFSINCIKYDLNEIIPGIYDSIKVFKVKYTTLDNDEFEFVLSKNFGLIKTSRYGTTKLKRELFELVGFSSGNKQFGMLPNTYNIENFFNLKIGDIKYWIYLYTKESFTLYDREKYYKDSLIDIVFEQTRIIFKYNRTEIEEGKSIKYDFLEIFEKNDLNQFLNNENSKYYILNFPIANNIKEYDLSYKKFVENCNRVANKTWTNKFNSLGYSLKYTFSFGDPSNCKFNFESSVQITEQILNPGISTSFIKSEGDGGSSVQILLAYKSGAEVLGVIPEPLSVNQELTSEEFSISPNPASDYINIDLSFLRLQESAIQIFDIYGNEMHPILPSGTTLEGNFKIDVSNLPPGVYFVRIGNKPPLKFIKL
jgi:hypothetical protein